jgi:hypothetical protein
MADIKLPLDLRGQDDACLPCEPMEVEKEGPRVHLHWKEPYNLPDSGTMEVKFRVKRREEILRGKEKRFELTIELLEITDVESDDPKAPAKGESETGTILDDLRKSLEK